MLIVRYGIGGVMVLGGIVMLIVSPAGLGVDGSRWPSAAACRCR